MAYSPRPRDKPDGSPWRPWGSTGGWIREAYRTRPDDDDVDARLMLSRFNAMRTIEARADVIMQVKARGLDERFYALLGAQSKSGKRPNALG